MREQRQRMLRPFIGRRRFHAYGDVRNGTKIEYNGQRDQRKRIQKWRESNKTKEAYKIKMKKRLNKGKTSDDRGGQCFCSHTPGP